MVSLESANGRSENPEGARLERILNQRFSIVFVHRPGDSKLARGYAKSGRWH